MATMQQLKSIFAPILAQNPDLVLHRRWLFKPPIRNAILGIFIDGQSDPAAPNFSLSILPLSRAGGPIPLGYNLRLYIERVIGSPKPQNPFLATMPSRFLYDMFAPEFAPHLIENFNAKARPFIDAHQSWEEILDWVGDPRWIEGHLKSREPTEGWCAMMAGDFARAASILLKYVVRMEAHFTEAPNPQGRPMPSDLVVCRALAETLATQDRARIVAHLRGMEAATIDHYKLQKYWQPTPFPFE
jgi:hypothetical protein